MPSRLPPAARPAGPEPADFVQAAGIFNLLAAPTRIRLLWLLADDELDVTSLAHAVHASMASVSQHLAKLKSASLVTARTEGRRQIYRIADAHIRTLVTQAMEHHSRLRSSEFATATAANS
jgi:DNA-binding transcriptional ArsR family regulator